VSAEPYELVVTPPARRALTKGLPEAVAAAVIDFITTSLLERPCRVGKPLRGDLAGVWSARRGTYRILCRLIDETREVVVLRVEHRRDVFPPR
jgi:mRNA interferase RelE/StbE